jgi:VCBS repeat-containing protein
MNWKWFARSFGLGLIMLGLLSGILRHPASAAGLPVAVDDIVYTPPWNMPYFSVLNVLGNDTWTGTATPALVTNGANGTFVLGPGGTFNYTPNPGFVGTDSFTYQITDNVGASNAATVTLVMDYEPVGNPDAYSTPFNTQLTVGAPGVIANDVDAEGPVLGATLVGNPSNGQIVSWGNDGSFTYAPNNGFTGTDQFSYIPYDDHDHGPATTVTITVDPPGNTPPIGVADNYTTTIDLAVSVSAPGVLSNDTDADSDPLTAAAQALPSHGTVTLNADGSFYYQPDQFYSGTDTFSYFPSDGTDLGNETWVTITINAPPPPVGVDDQYTVHQAGVLTVNPVGVLANDIANAGQINAGGATQPAHGTLQFNQDGSFTYKPDPLFVGVDSFQYQPYNPVSGNMTTVTITVVPNDAPVGADDHYTTTSDKTLTIPAPGVLANDTDTENDPLIAWPGDDPIWGSWILHQDGTLEYFPDPNYTGDDVMTYVPGDALNYGNETKITITILPPNSATPEPTNTPSNGTPGPTDTPGGETATPAPSDSPGDETETPTPTDTTSDETSTPTPTDTTGDETSTPAATDTPSVPTTSDDPTPAPPVATDGPGSDVGGVTTLPITGAGPADGSGNSLIPVVLAILGLGGISFSLWRLRSRRPN